jgi:hypothetical protein
LHSPHTDHDAHYPHSRSGPHSCRALSQQADIDAILIRLGHSHAYRNSVASAARFQIPTRGYLRAFLRRAQVHVGGTPRRTSPPRYASRRSPWLCPSRPRRRYRRASNVTPQLTSYKRAAPHIPTSASPSARPLRLLPQSPAPIRRATISLLVPPDSVPGFDTELVLSA